MDLLLMGRAATSRRCRLVWSCLDNSSNQIHSRLSSSPEGVGGRNLAHYQSTLAQACECGRVLEKCQWDLTGRRGWRRQDLRRIRHTTSWVSSCLSTTCKNKAAGCTGFDQDSICYDSVSSVVRWCPSDAHVMVARASSHRGHDICYLVWLGSRFDRGLAWQSPAKNVLDLGLEFVFLAPLHVVLLFRDRKLGVQRICANSRQRRPRSGPGGISGRASVPP
jgi:hypothetical protein